MTPMTSDRNEEIRDSLDKLYAHLDEVQQDTRSRLGIDSLHIVDLHANNWIDIVSWIASKYSRDEQMNIFMLHFVRLFKEIYWLEFLLHNANYPMIYRNLRYVLEMICQAYYVDTHHHGLAIDEQVEKSKEIEEKRLYGWNIVQSVLVEVFGDREVKATFQPLWARLCRHVHPSATEMDVTVMADFSILVTDLFNEDLAREAMKTTDDVLDAVYAIVFRRFPKIKDDALMRPYPEEWAKCLPKTVRAIKDDENN